MPGRRKKIRCLPLSLCTDVPSPKKNRLGERLSLPPSPPDFFLRRGASAHRLIMVKAFRTLLMCKTHTEYQRHIERYEHRMQVTSDS